MRKLLSLLAVLWVATAMFANNDPTKAFYKTYSVKTAPYTTKYMTFEPYHANIQLDKLLRVSDNGDFHIDLDYLTGMKLSKEKLVSDNTGSYYSVSFTIPSYQVAVYDKAKQLVLEKTYGGTDAKVKFGQGQNYDEKQLATAWAAQKNAFLQQTEFQHLTFDLLQEDLLTLAGKLEASAGALTSTIEEAPSVEKATEDIFADTPATFFEEASEEVAVNDELAEKTAPTKVILNPRSNLVKLNLPNLSFKNITLNYERILSDRSSASLHVGYIIPSALSATTLDALEITPKTNNEFSGFTVTGEYRRYGKKKGAPRGLYYAPYLRYANYKYLFDETIEGNFTNIEARLSTFGLGAQLGYQWIIKDRFVIDWGILGVAAQRYTISSTFSSKDDAVKFEEIQKELETESGSSSILGGGIEFTQGDDFLKAKLPFLFGGLRSYFSVGMQF